MSCLGFAVLLSTQHYNPGALDIARVLHGKHWSHCTRGDKCFLERDLRALASVPYADLYEAYRAYLVEAPDDRMERVQRRFDLGVITRLKYRRNSAKPDGAMFPFVDFPWFSYQGAWYLKMPENVRLAGYSGSAWNPLDELSDFELATNLKK